MIVKAKGEKIWYRDCGPNLPDRKEISENVAFMKSCKKVRIDGWQVASMNDVIAKGVDREGERDWQYFMDTKSGLDYCDQVFSEKGCIGISTVRLNISENDQKP